MLILAYLLPWTTGAILLIWLESFSAQQRRINLPRVLGYGFFLGNFICAAAVYFLFAAFGQLSVWPVTALLLILTFLGIHLNWQKLRSEKLSLQIALPMIKGRSNWLVLLLVILITVHILLATYDAINRPLLPWDAWTTWVYRAKIWFLNQELSPFVSASTWLSTPDAGVYTISAHAYPPLVSLIFLWPAMAHGQWNDAFAIFPGLLAGTALVLALYGQGRSLGWPILLVITGIYLLTSIPLLGAHLALPGYADLWLSGFAGLGFVALLQWSQSRDKLQLFMGMLFLLLGIFIKREGSLWLLMGLLFVIIQSSSWKLLLALAVAAAMAIFSGHSLINLPWLGWAGYADGVFYLPRLGAIALQPQDVSFAVVSNLFASSSWNLLYFYTAALLLLLFLHSARGIRQPVASFILLLSIVIATVFFLSAEGAWVKDSTAFGRLLLQVLPAQVFVLLLTWKAVFQAPISIQADAQLETKQQLHYPMFASLALSALVVSAAVLVALYPQNSDNSLSEKTLPVSLESFRFIEGGGRRVQGTLTIDHYTNGKAIISSSQGLESSDTFRYLHFQLTAEKLLDDLPQFFWRSADTGKLHSVSLEENALDHLDLSRHQEWHGKVSEFGFMFSENNGQHWRLQGLGFSADTLRQSIFSLASDWLEFEVWSQHSINFIYGGATDNHPSLVVVVGVWILLALLFYASLIRWRKQLADGRKVAAVLLLGWMLLDARWLFNLYQQMQQTHHSYAGKPLSEQYKAGLDTAHYRFFQHLKEEVLPKSPQYIYVLDTKTGYFRAKAPWFLAPHNIFNLDSYPRPEYLKKGGYVLILHQIPGLRYDPRSQALHWGKDGILPVSPVYLHPLGTLYQIRQPAN